MGNSEGVGYDPTVEGELISTEKDYSLYCMPTGHHYQKHSLRLPSTPHTVQSYTLRIQKSRPELVQAVYAGSSPSTQALLRHESTAHLPASTRWWWSTSPPGSAR